MDNIKNRLKILNTVPKVYQSIENSKPTLDAIIASRMAVKRGANFVRWVIVVIILLTAAHLFGIVDFKALLKNN